MSNFARLDMGFVTWQSQRVFVPSWFGAPRIVPTTDGESRVLKLKYRMYPILAVYLVASLIAGIWIPVVESLDAFVLSVAVLLSIIPLILGIFIVLEHNSVKRWPKYTVSRFSRLGFMLGYFRSLPVRARLYELCLGLLGLWVFVPELMNAGEAALANSGDIWSPARVAIAGLILGGLGLATLFAARHALFVAMALVPRALWRIYQAG